MESVILTRKPGDRRDPSTSTSFACKGGRYARRSLAVLLALFLFLSVAASAADLKIKVVDPQAAAVARRTGVAACGQSDGRILDTQSTSAEGVATFRMPGSGAYQIRVLAPGFAAETVEVSSQTEITVSLRLATASETVVVSGDANAGGGRGGGGGCGYSQRGAIDDDAADGGQ